MLILDMSCLLFISLFLMSNVELHIVINSCSLTNNGCPILLTTGMALTNGKEMVSSGQEILYSLMIFFLYLNN